MICENCPAGWEDRSYEGECEDCGCLIYGHGIFNDSCKLSMNTVKERLRELEDYEAGKITRPQWVANRFIREMDAAIWSLPAFPPFRMRDGAHTSIYSERNLRADCYHYYQKGYADGKAGKDMEVQ